MSRPFSHTFMGTALWVLPCMLVLMVGGFLLARDYFAPKYLDPSEVRVNDLKPVRVLSPSEARLAASDEPSRVWTEGVKPSDIPKLQREPSDSGTPRRERRRDSTRTRNDTTTAPAATPAPTTATTTPAPVPAPAPAPAPQPTDIGDGTGDIPRD